MRIMSAIRKVIIFKGNNSRKYPSLRHGGIRDFRASSRESRRKVRLVIKGEYLETNFFKIGHSFVGRSTLNSSLLDTHFEVNYRRLMSERMRREEKDEEKKRARAGNSSRRYKPCWAFVFVNKTNRRFEFACELPRSGISRSTAMVFSFELTPLPLRPASFSPRSLDSRPLLPIRDKNEEPLFARKSATSKRTIAARKTRAELTRKVFNPVRNDLRSYGQTSIFLLKLKWYYLFMDIKKSETNNFISISQSPSHKKFHANDISLVSS